MYTTGVPLSPLPDVKSQSEPIRSVILLGVVPWDAIFPTKLPLFSLIFSLNCADVNFVISGDEVNEDANGGVSVPQQVVDFILNNYLNQLNLHVF